MPGLSDFIRDMQQVSNNKGTPAPPLTDRIKEWTRDPNKGDRHYTGEGSGKGWYPIWKQETEVAGDKMIDRYEELTDPQSGYYKSIGKQIRNTISGAVSPNSLLALTVAMGGSPTQAAEQMKAMEGRIGDTTSNLMNQYYLNASGQATSLLGQYGNLAQFQESQRHALEQYKDQQRQAVTGDVLGAIGQIASYALAPATGGASMIAGNAIGNSFQNTPLNTNYNMTNGQGFWGLYQNRYGSSPGMGGR